MKNLVAIFTFLLASAGIVKGQTVSIEIDAGILQSTAGTPVPVGGLLQLIASPSGVFTPPTSNSFISGDNTLVANFGMNNNGGVTGETDNPLNNLSLAGLSLTVGEQLLLRWYPSLTYSGPAAQPPPGVGAFYGAARSDTTEFTTDPRETAWVVPPAGAKADLFYIFTNDAGTYADTPLPYPASSSLANSLVVPIPEPSTNLLMACGVVGVSIALVRKRKCHPTGD